jgi:pSer/pThr/pTyr-binding forkhead associated (FHA) protein
MVPIRVRGRHEEIIACNVMWRTDPDLTEINLARATATRSRETVLKLSRAGQLHIVRSMGPAVRIGREKDNDVVVDSQFASRVHARVFAREGHFVIADQSSNGTYVLADGNSTEILLRREEAVLGERGWIGLGNSATRHGDHALRYRVEPEWD